MLGILKMDIGECRAAFEKFAPKLFYRNQFFTFPGGNVISSILGKSWFDVENLQEAIQAMLKQKGLPVGKLFTDEAESRCKV
jgi:hypothetical protein